MRGGGGGRREAGPRTRPQHQQPHRHQPASTAAVLLVVCLPLLCVGVGAVSHWVVSSSGLIVAKTDSMVFKPSSAGSGALLAEFLAHEALLARYRNATRTLDSTTAQWSAKARGCKEEGGASCRDVDLLSKMPDWQQHLKLKDVSLMASTVIMPPLDEDVTGALDTEAGSGPGGPPRCIPYLDYSPMAMLHLESISRRQTLEGKPEPDLLSVWEPFKPVDNAEMGRRIQRVLAKNSQSWVAQSLAALYWRIEGNAPEAIECGIKALNASPVTARDVPLVSLANVLLRAERYSDAETITKAAVDYGSPKPDYAALLTHGNILALSQDYLGAISAYETAITVDPERNDAYLVREAVTTQVKAHAVRERRNHEINLRKLTMVLPQSLSWHSFDYEAITNLCAEAVCSAEHAYCSDIDGNCHCSEGWLPQQGQCVPDTKCAGLECQANAICRDGRCFCNLGKMTLDGECVPDPCAGVVCVENAVCNRRDGRCRCKPPYVARGAECITPDCVSIRCRERSFCQRGLCYCAVGYHPDVDFCAPDAPCAKSKCPEHSSCDPADGHCRCDPGFEADVNNNLCTHEGATSTPALPPLAKKKQGERTKPRQQSPSPHLEEVQHPVTVAKEEAPAPTPPPSPPSPPPSPPPKDTSNPGPVAETITQHPWLQPGWVSEDTCLDIHRAMPAWNEYPSTYLPPFMKELSLKQMGLEPHHIANPTLEPLCSSQYGAQASEELDDLPGVRDRASLGSFRAEKGLYEVARKTFKPHVSMAEFGQVVSLGLEHRPLTWEWYNLGALYWRVKGNAKETLNCVRYALKYNPAKSRDIALTNAANVLHRANCLQDAEAVARLALSSSSDQRTIAHFTLASTLAAQGKLEEAAAELESSLEFQPGFELALHTLRTIRCVLMQQGQVAQLEDLERQKQTARQLKTELDELRLLLDTTFKKLLDHSDDESAAARRKAMMAQMVEAEELLSIVLKKHQALNQNIKQKQLENSALLASASASLPAVTEHLGAPATPPPERAAPPAAPTTTTGKSGERVIVVEYPKSPSIPSLISALEDMLDREQNRSEQPFHDPNWPTRPQCSERENPALEVLSIRLPMAVSLEEALAPVPPPDTVPEQYLEPFCSSPVPNNGAHTLQHLSGVANRVSLDMREEAGMAKLLETELNGELGEIGHRVGLCLKLNSSSWVLLNVAGLYWRAKGDAYQGTECLRRAFFHAPSQSKDVALVSLASVMHLAGEVEDALTLLQMGIQVSPKQPVTHLGMANVLASLGERGYEEAAFFLEVALEYLPAGRTDVLDRLLTLRCRQLLGRQGAAACDAP